jgi:hypothetical protein
MMHMVTFSWHACRFQAVALVSLGCHKFIPLPRSCYPPQETENREFRSVSSGMTYVLNLIKIRVTLLALEKGTDMGVRVNNSS